MELIETLYKKGGIKDRTTPIALSQASRVESVERLLLEGIDFDLLFTPLPHLGYKAILATLAPLYAMGYTPLSIEITIALSSKFSQEKIEELWMGMVEALKEHNIKESRLNLVPSLTGLTIALSSIGEQPESNFVQIPKPKEGELLVVNGHLGAPYLGLQILLREKRLFEETGVEPKLENYREVVGAYLKPSLESGLFEELRSKEILPSTGYFIDQGLAHAVKSLCLREGVGAKIFMDKIAIASYSSKVAEELNISSMTAALNGGDDFRFLLSIPLSHYEKLAREFPHLDIIGHLAAPEAGETLITPDGEELELKAQAWSK